MFNRLFPLFAIVLFALGCAQEGKLIDIPLAVRGVAYDERTVTADSANIAFETRIKVQVHAANPCEKKHVLLELSRIVSPTTTTYVIRPIARYNVDDACTNDPPGSSDTTVVLTVAGLGVRVAAPVATPVIINNNEGPAFVLAIDSTYHPSTPATMRFRVKVESLLDGSAIAGASVQLDSLSIVGGGVGPIGSPVVTDALGLAIIDVPSTVPVSENAFRYQVTVTNGTDVRVMQVRDAPARGQSIERVYIRI